MKTKQTGDEYSQRRKTGPTNNLWKLNPMRMTMPIESELMPTNM